MEQNKNKETHERVAVTGSLLPYGFPTFCPKCNGYMINRSSFCGIFEYVCYSNCDAVMMEKKYRGQTSD